MADVKRLQIRRDTLADWVAVNPILLEGEVGLIIENGRISSLKIGDGVSSFVQLPQLTLLEAVFGGYVSRQDLSASLRDYATIQYVESEIDKILGGASGAYDTLKEIEDILKNDTTGLSALLEEIGTKADTSVVDALASRVSQNESNIADHTNKITANTDNIDSTIRRVADNEADLEQLIQTVDKIYEEYVTLDKIPTKTSQLIDDIGYALARNIKALAGLDIVTKDYIADAAVTTSKVKDGAITSDKLSSAVQQQLSWIPSTTDNLTEGSSNLYFTNDRAISAVSPRLIKVENGLIATQEEVRGYSAIISELQGTVKSKADQSSVDSLAEAIEAINEGISDLTTDDVYEGANKYFTNARAVAALDGASLNSLKVGGYGVSENIQALIQSAATVSGDISKINVRIEGLDGDVKRIDGYCDDFNASIGNLESSVRTNTTDIAGIETRLDNLDLCAITESTVSGWGFTKNTGTITGIKMNSVSKGTSGVVDLGTVLTSHQTIHSLTIKNSDESYSLTYTPNSSSLSITLGKSWVGLNNVRNVASYSQDEVKGLLKDYLPLSGGTITGTEDVLKLKNSSGGEIGLKFDRAQNTSWYIYAKGGNLYFRDLSSSEDRLSLLEKSQGGKIQIKGNIDIEGTITNGTWNGSKITNAYLDKSTITVAGQEIPLGGEAPAENLKGPLGITALSTTVSNHGTIINSLDGRLGTIEGNYLPLSGGIITNNSNSLPLMIRSSYGDETAITFDRGTTRKAVFGYYDNLGAFMWNSSAGSRLYLTDAKGLKWSPNSDKSYDIIHSGNISDYTLAKDSNGTVSLYGDIEVLSADNSVTIKNGSIISNTGGTDFWSIDDSGNGVFNSLKVGTDSVALASDLSEYLRKDGGGINGNLTVYGDFGFSGTLNSRSHYLFVRSNDDADWVVTDKNWQHEYNLIHTGNISSHAVTSSNLESTLSDYPLANGTRATGTWGIDISGSAAKLDSNTLMSQISDWNSGFSSSIFRSSEHFVSNSPRIDFTYGIHLRFHRDTNTYYTDLVTSLYNDVLSYRRHTENGFGSWKTIAFTDSTVNKAKILVDANDAYLVYKTSAGHLYVGDNIYTSGDTHILGKNIRLRYGESASYGLILNSSGSVTIGSSDLAGSTEHLNVANILGIERATGDAAARFKISEEDATVNYIHLYVASNNDGHTNSRPLVLQNGYGNVGIGTINPNTKLHVVGGAKITGGLTVGSATDYIAYDGSSLTGYKSSAAAWSIDPSGNGSFASLTVNTNTLLRGGSTNPYLGLLHNGTNYYVQAYDGFLMLGAGADNSMWIAANGNVEIQKAFDVNYADGYVRIVDGSIFSTYGTSTSWEIMDDGSAYFAEVNTPSDSTKKNILSNIELTTSHIANAPAVSFTWKASGRKSCGTIAQYWKDVLPEVVSGDEGNYGMNYAVLGVVSSIILARNIETHEQRIARLEKEISDLQKELNALVNNE